MGRRVDVCVVGAGPAGASVAQRLARLGHSVCVVERAAFPRGHIGESLPASILPVLEALGVRERVEGAGFLRPARAFVRWTGGTESLRETGQPGFQVDRARFDALLLDAARDAGADVLQPARAAPPVETPDGWRVPITTAQGARAIEARFLVDATGRRSGFLGAGSVVGPRTAALYGYWAGARLDGSETRVEAGEEAWYWGAPLPDGTVNATVVMGARACAGLGAQRREDTYRRLLARSALLCGCLDGSLVAAVRACDASLLVDERPAGRTFVRAGEAAFAIDPLSSQGVQAAITSGLSAAAVAHTILILPERAPLAVAFYERRQREVLARHRRLAAAHYAERAAQAPTPFWLDRARLPDEAPPPRDPRDSRAPREGRLLWLASEASLVQAPVLDGDVIADGEALHHPDLARPVAFVGEVALAPLLRLLDGPDEATAIVRRWCRVVPPSTCWSIVDWLWQRRVLVTGA